MPRVELEHVEKVFRGANGEPIRAVEDLSFGVEAGELLVLLGPSGCGKTTTLRLVAGLDEPTSGVIKMGGQVVTHCPPAERDVGMVFQSPALYPHLSGFENMALGLKLRRFPQAEIEQRVHRTAEMLGLMECLQRRPSALSGGQQQRLALGRALVRRVGVLLLDEPLSGLDAPARAGMRTELAAVHQATGTTMLYVTHDQLEAMALGQRIAVMREGHIEQVGTPDEIYQQPRNVFVAAFIGSPTINLIQGTIVKGAEGLLFGLHPQPGSNEKELLPLALEPPLALALASYAGRTVILGLRPEHILLETAPGAGLRVPFVPVEVERIERTGPEVCLQLRGPGRMALSARTFATADITRGQKLSVRLDVRQGHFFDPSSGRRLC